MLGGREIFWRTWEVHNLFRVHMCSELFQIFEIDGSENSHQRHNCWQLPYNTSPAYRVSLYVNIPKIKSLTATMPMGWALCLSGGFKFHRPSIKIHEHCVLFHRNCWINSLEPAFCSNMDGGRLCHVPAAAEDLWAIWHDVTDCIQYWMATRQRPHSAEWSDRR